MRCVWGAGWGVQPSLGSRGPSRGSRHWEEWREVLAGQVGIMNHLEQVSSKDLDLGERKRLGEAQSRHRGSLRTGGRCKEALRPGPGGPC